MWGLPTKTHLKMAKLLIDSQFFKHNLDLIASHIGSKNKMALVLKDNAYGHGIKEITQLARDYGIKSVFVKNEREALQIKDDFDHITAFYGVISPDAPSNIYQTVHSLHSLKSIKHGRKIELKINAGMNRNGIEVDQIQEAMQIILKHRLSLFGVFSHNGYGDEGGKEMEYQRRKSQEIKDYINAFVQANGLPTPRFHFLSSSSALRQGFIDEDLIRIGIAGYGYLCASIPIASQLKPIASLWADQISQRFLKAGERIGYGGAGVMPYDAVVSTYDLGYGDGLMRLNENHSSLTCADGEAILPRISMDCFSCLSEKSEICVFKDAYQWSEVFHTTPYEILVKLSNFIPKEIV